MAEDRWSPLDYRRDVQMLAGHHAHTTQRYIEADTAAQKRVVDLI